MNHIDRDSQVTIVCLLSFVLFLVWGVSNIPFVPDEVLGKCLTKSMKGDHYNAEILNDCVKSK